MNHPSTTSEERGLPLADLCIRRPVFAVMMNLLLVVLGLFSFARLGIDQLPNVELPIITVTTTLRGASPEEVETSVTKPLEEIINTIQGVDEINSTSREGVSRINVQFLFERSRDLAAQDVRDKVMSILSRLPEGTETPVVDKFDIDATPIVTFSLSGSRDLREVTYLADKVVKQNLETVRDVGAVNLVGVRTRAVQVDVDVDRLRARGLTITDVRSALLEQNLELPEGRVEQGSRELVVRTLGRMARVRDFNDLIIANIGGQPVYLRDVATVSDGVEEPRSLSRFNGTNSVSVVVRKQSGVNTVAVCDAVKERAEELKAQLPPDLQLNVIRDQSRFIRASLNEVSFHLVLGAVLVALTVFFFLHDWRGTIIASIAIPASIVATFTLMRAMDYTLNDFTMLGLIFAVGIVIDDAIVVLENIERLMAERGLDPVTAARLGTREIATAVLATTLSLVVIFLPLAFMGGRVGRFFNSYGVTVAFAIMVSLFISFTLTPMLASRFLRHTDDPERRRKKGEGGVLMRWLGRQYTAVLGWSLRHRWVVVLAAAGCFAGLRPLFQATRFTYFPVSDMGDFEIQLNTPEGSSLARTAEVCGQIERRLKQLRLEGQPVVTDVLITCGDTSGRVGKAEGDVTRATYYCRMPPQGGFWSTLIGRTRRWTVGDALSQARRVLAEFPDLRASVQTLSNIQGSGGRGLDLQFNLIGPDLGRLIELSEQLMEEMRAQGEFVDVDTTLSNRKPELQVHIDRAKASQFGLSVSDIASALRTIVGGETVGAYKEADDQYDVWLRAETADRDTQEALEKITLRAAGGHAGSESGLVPLVNFVRLQESRGPNQIERYQRQRRVQVQSNLRDLALGEAVQLVRGYYDKLEAGAEYQLVATGRAKAFKESNQNFITAFLVALMFMYMILAAQFEHFVHPVSILLAVPLSLPFALLPFALTGEPLNIFGVFGLFMLFGIVKKNGILQVDYTNTLRARGLPRDEAILQANKVRLRPILMTTMMLVASMIPIALGRGPGSAGRAAMAKVIIYGQLLCLLLTLLVTPVSYAIFDDLGRRLRRKKKA